MRQRTTLLKWAPAALFVVTGALADDGINLDIDLDESGDLEVISSDVRHDLRLEQFQVRTNQAFGVGERAVYSVRYGLIRAGEATLSVEESTTVNGRPCLALSGTASSNDFFSSIFSVDDEIRSWIDEEFLIPWRFEKELHEGDFHAEQSIDLDQVNRVATYGDGRTFPMDAEVQDALSALFFIRTLDLRVGSKRVLRTHADRKNVDLAGEVVGRERVDTPAGKFDCLAVEPTILLDTGLYDSKKGSLTMYVTDDSRRLPVLFKIKVFFGSLVLTLTDYRPSQAVAENGPTAG
jgi:hypothetical protein